MYFATYEKAGAVSIGVLTPDKDSIIPLVEAEQQCLKTKTLPNTMLELLDMGQQAIDTVGKLLDQAVAGDNIGALLRGVDRKEIERGQVLAKPGSIHPHTKFKGEVYVLTKEEGGRHTPFFNGYRPQFYFRTTDVTGNVTLPEGTEMVMPGDNITMDIELITPIAIEAGLRFAIREGGRTVGAGVVTAINADK